MPDFDSIAKELDVIEGNGALDGLRKLQGFQSKAQDLLSSYLALLFPISSDSKQIAKILSLRKFFDELTTLLGYSELSPQTAEIIISQLPLIQQLLLGDAKAILEGDPAAKTLEEVILCYPGFYAIAVHRLAHVLEKHSASLLARFLSEAVHRQTGIDIHPGASIGERFCIDHGTGIVIGETSILGNDVKLYHGVTLGGLSVLKSLASKKRHPTIEDNVVIYSNAVILGGETIIGRDSIIGGNVWLTHSVDFGSIVEQEKRQLNIKKRTN